MNEIKHTPGPWRIVEREILEDGSVYPRHIVGGEEDHQVCLLESTVTAELAIRHPNECWVNNQNGKLLIAAPDMLMVLEMLAADADAGKAMIPSGLRLSIDAALIKAGRKAAPEPARHITTAGGAL
ncbi:hypothetical protein [Burkholderia vietnamiensis]|uniref:hypothetical protein n=1 Tax=Burkholderia vietnamiensis TaxID=60552 RepID=UPI0015937853|nr:hypothetical protein [Burkholderia vietnamiensis]